MTKLEEKDDYSGSLFFLCKHAGKRGTLTDNKKKTRNNLENNHFFP